MENNYQGDLADIFRGGNNINSTSGESSSTTSVVAVSDGWQFPAASINYSAQDFGDPFCNLRDPFFHHLDMMPATSSLFNSIGGDGDENNNNNNNNGNDDTSLFGPKIDSSSMKRRPSTNTGSNMFSRMLQISPTTKFVMSPPCHDIANAPSNVIGSLVPNHDAINSSKSCLVENSGLQISSPRNTGIKRRKTQAKKVVCIPAAAPANSRQGGEVVPSDLWAWRKYGQKPIKGSPYPRGYYRCSSSKGCSARKQVERSRTDPNMLVITYTSEHNHPWPTQRNALAGSTRSSSHPNNSKHTITSTSTSTSTSNNNITTSASSIPNNSQSQITDTTTFKQDHEQNESNIINHDKNINTTNVAELNISTCPKVKEENNIMAEEDRLVDVQFSQDSYQPILPDSDFFADLVELEADPLNLFFAKTLSGEINEVGQKKAGH